MTWDNARPGSDRESFATKSCERSFVAGCKASPNGAVRAATKHAVRTLSGGCGRR